VIIASGEQQTILLRTDAMITLFVRYRDSRGRNGDQSRRAGHSVEATIDTTFDGPTYTLAICETAEVAAAIRDQLAEAMTDGTFDDGGLWRLDDVEGLHEDGYDEE
jgi:hypothetical protein